MANDGGRLMVRDLEVIDSELRLVADIRRTCRERDWPLPSCKRANDLLDERNKLRRRPVP
jgi:hypothetical protein